VKIEQLLLPLARRPILRSVHVVRETSEAFRQGARRARLLLFDSHLAEPPTFPAKWASSKTCNASWQKHPRGLLLERL